MQWKKETTTLASVKDQLYGEVHKLKAKVQEVKAVKKCMEHTIPPEQTKAKEQKEYGIVIVQVA